MAETAPSGAGRRTAVALAEAGISTTLITDGAIFAMMARVNKVIVGAQAVMANGGLMATAGSHMLALAAAHHSVPFVVSRAGLEPAPLAPARALVHALRLRPAEGRPLESCRAQVCAGLYKLTPLFPSGRDI